MVERLIAVAGRVGAALALAAALCGGAAAPARAQTGESVAAVVNDEVISTWDVRQRSLLILIGAGIEPSAEALDEVRAQALRSLIDERLQIQEAAGDPWNITVTEEQIDNAFDGLARDNQLTAEQLQAQLIASGVSPLTVREQLRAEIAWRRLVGGRFSSRVRIPEVRINDTLQRIAANAAKPQNLVSEILLPAETPEDLAAAEAFGQRLINEMRQGAPFPLVARQFSGAPTAASGGDLGWLAQGELRPELQAVVDRLQPGQISVPVRGPGGVYILALRERRAGVDVASLNRVALRQVSAPQSARAALERALRQNSGCDGLEQRLADVSGAAVVDLGESAESELAEEVRSRVAPLQPGASTPVFAAGEGVAALVLCARRQEGGGAPSREEIENRLFQQEIAMLSQRYLRNLRREATIITRNR